MSRWCCNLEGAIDRAWGFHDDRQGNRGVDDGAFTLLEATEPPHFGPPIHVRGVPEQRAEVDATPIRDCVSEAEPSGGPTNPSTRCRFRPVSDMGDTATDLLIWCGRMATSLSWCGLRTSRWWPSGDSCVQLNRRKVVGAGRAGAIEGPEDAPVYPWYQGCGDTSERRQDSDGRNPVRRVAALA